MLRRKSQDKFGQRALRVLWRRAGACDYAATACRMLQTKASASRDIGKRTPGPEPRRSTSRFGLDPDPSTGSWRQSPCSPTPTAPDAQIFPADSPGSEIHSHDLTLIADQPKAEATAAQDGQPWRLITLIAGPRLPAVDAAWPRLHTGPSLAFSSICLRGACDRAMAFSNIAAKCSPFIELTAIAVSFGLSKGRAIAAAPSEPERLLELR